MPVDRFVHAVLNDVLLFWADSASRPNPIRDVTVDDSIFLDNLICFFSYKYAKYKYLLIIYGVGNRVAELDGAHVL